MIRRPPSSPLFPYPTLFRSVGGDAGRAPPPPPQFRGTGPCNLRRAGGEERGDDAVALVECRAPTCDECVQMECVFCRDERERGQRDALAGETGGRKWGGRFRNWCLCRLLATG